MTEGVDLDRFAGLPSYRPAQVEKPAPCQLDCASGGDVRGWIGVVAQRHRNGLTADAALDEAWRIITDVNPFPGVLGRICPHPCQTGCNRTTKDEPVAVNALERFIGDWGIDHQLKLETVDFEPREESIGVIGAGPSGLSFAYQMARRGYPVTVYERSGDPGGMLRFGVPDYRLPPGVLDAEIERIMDLGVEVVTGVAVGKEVSIDDLRDRHHALYLGIGAQAGRVLGLPGEDGVGVFSGIDYLRRVNRGETVEVGDRVVVIGGGNTAIDAARVARRSGAEVTILYRRTRAEMPAVASEIDDAEREGIAIDFLVAPVSVQRSDGLSPTMTAQRMALGDPGPDGRRRPYPVPDSEFDVAADTIIAAVSQQVEGSVLESIGLDNRWPEPDGNGWLGDDLLAGGDVAGPAIAGRAIRDGRQAAESLHRRLRGVPEPPPDPRNRITFDDVNLRTKPEAAHAIGATHAAEYSLSHPEDEVVATLTEEEFFTEVERCFSCGLCSGCSACWMFCTVGSFSAVEFSRPGHYFTMDLQSCEECGKCIEVCPCGYLEPVV